MQPWCRAGVTRDVVEAARGRQVARPLSAAAVHWGAGGAGAGDGASDGADG